MNRNVWDEILMVNSYVYLLFNVYIFVDADNCNRFTTLVVNFPILNIMCGLIRIIHINNISVHV
jgi:uncharacterized membrane protein (DUF2068 family)